LCFVVCTFLFVFLPSAGAFCRKTQERTTAHSVQIPSKNEGKENKRNQKMQNNSLATASRPTRNSLCVVAACLFVVPKAQGSIFLFVTFFGCCLLFFFCKRTSSRSQQQGPKKKEERKKQHLFEEAQKKRMKMNEQERENDGRMSCVFFANRKREKSHTRDTNEERRGVSCAFFLVFTTTPYPHRFSWPFFSLRVSKFPPRSLKVVVCVVDFLSPRTPFRSPCSFFVLCSFC